MKKIYFACSIRGGRDHAATYVEIVEYIKTQADVLTEIFADGALTSQGMNKPNHEIWTKDTDWIKEADGIIAEVTNPSLGVGYEIAFAETLHKPVLALYKYTNDKKLSAMIAGSPGVHVFSYQDVAETQTAITQFISTL